TWWFWMLVPGFMFVGKGIGEIISANRLAEQNRRNALDALKGQQTSLNNSTASQRLPDGGYQPRADYISRETGELVMPPPSVTETTTRHLDLESNEPTKRFPTIPSGPSDLSDLSDSLTDRPSHDKI
ncbi:MAG: hypothetical protein ACRD4L_08350, partial [Pyrinomonadaceae bacterium]